MRDVTIDPTGYDAEFGDYFALLKPRVMSLVVFTALVGLLAAPVSLHPVEAFCAVLFIAIGGGASGALNMWWDADIDGVMKRTVKRPIPAGKVTPESALYLGVALSAFSVIMLGLSTNWFAAGWLAFTIFFYAVIYTMWLKRSTPQNIVIGGAAGAFPPLVGWVAATGSVSIEAVLMFAITFMWTPPHFWALALFTRMDYDDAKVPMLTVTHGRPSARLHILIYAGLLSALVLAASFTGIGGPIYLAVAVICSLVVMRDAVRIWMRDDAAAEADNYAVERSFFKFSLIYLFVIYLAILVGAFAAPWGLGAWT